MIIDMGNPRSGKEGWKNSSLLNLQNKSGLSKRPPNESASMDNSAILSSYPRPGIHVSGAKIPNGALLTTRTTPNGYFHFFPNPKILFFIATISVFTASCLPLSDSEKAVKCAMKEICYFRNAPERRVKITMIEKRDNNSWWIFYDIESRQLGTHGSVEVSSDFKILDHQLGR